MMVISNVVRPPTISRLSTSRPIESVPSQCRRARAGEGIWRRLRGIERSDQGRQNRNDDQHRKHRDPETQEQLAASSDEDRGAQADSYGRHRHRLPERPRSCLDPRVDARIRDVDQHIDHDDDTCSQHHDGLDHRIITAVDGIEQVLAHAGNGENGLDQDAAAEQ